MKCYEARAHNNRYPNGSQDHRDHRVTEPFGQQDPAIGMFIGTEDGSSIPNLDVSETAETQPVNAESNSAE